MAKGIGLFVADFPRNNPMPHLFWIILPSTIT